MSNMDTVWDNKIYSTAGREFKYTWLSAVIWNAITWLAIIKGGNNILQAFDANPVFYFFVTFPFIGIWLVILATMQTLAWIKFKKTPVVLNPFPGQIGGALSGYLDIPVAVSDANLAKTTLTCSHKYWDTSGNESRLRHTAKWQDLVNLQPEAYGKGSRIHFGFNPPEDMPETPDESEKDSHDYYEWSLQFKIDLPGHDFDRNFIVPVKNVSQSQIDAAQRFNHKTSPIVKLEDSPEGVVPKITTTPAGTKFRYPAGREKMVSFVLFFVALFIGGFSMMFFAGGKEFMPTVMALIAAYIGMITLILFLLSLYLIFNHKTVEIGIMGINLTYGIANFKWSESLDAEDIVNITTEQSSSSSTGKTTRVWYKLVAYLKDGSKREVGDTLEGARYAEEIRDKMLTCLGHNWQASEPVTTKMQKMPIPNWLKVLGRIFSRLFSLSFLVAAVYDFRYFFISLFERFL